MALRLCKGNYEIATVTNQETTSELFKKKQKDKYIILKKDDDYIGFVTPNKEVKYTILTKENFFEEAKNALTKENVEYIPVVDKNKIIGFVYDDEYLNDALNKIKDLISFITESEIKKEYENAIIYGYNELAYYLETLFKKNNIDYKINDAIFGNNKTINKTNKTMEIYVEGNNGNPIQEYAFWKVFHEWLYESVKPIYDLYAKCNEFKYDNEKIICDYLDNSKPFMMARVGNTELWIIKQYIQKNKKIINEYSDFWLNYLFETSGFFAKDNNINDVDEFASQHISAIENCDFNLCYGNDELAEGLNITLQSIQKEHVYNFDWNLLTNPFNNNWFPHLDGKTILVISPYSKSIEMQTNKLTKLYNKNYPNIKIKTYQTLETQLNNNQGYQSFFEALEKMEQDIKEIDFDVAFICAGAYGFLLADYIKRIGKSSIELCSYVPNWFGIKIKRYCTYLNVNKYWNENWIFPTEKPIKNSEKIEDSCYWE